MKTRRIGALDVTVLGLGCNNFGRRLDYEQTARVIDAALDAGVTFLDTADVYGDTKSEELIGRALEKRRDRVVLATKFGMALDESRKGAHPSYVRRACEDSLRRLRTDRIDLYQLHRPDPATPIADTLGALEALVAEGKVREIGCSNFSVAELDEAKAATNAAGKERRGFVSVQNEMSLLHRDPERDVLPWCEREHVAMIPYFPLASGALTGKYRKGAPAPEGSRLAGGGPLADRFLSQIDVIERLRGWAEGRGHTLGELAIAWLLAHGPIASVIAGATREEQVRANAKAVEWTLSAEERDAVRALLEPGR